ncbi:ABC transporter substrate-binding protein [Planctomycetota bacterium]|nr:ABC transporter substrate-binding protein [Planctomycetota bacterium]
MQKYWTVMAITTALMVTLIVGCKGDNGSGVTEDSVKLGLFVSTSGKISTFGQDTKNGVDLAVKEINAAGGIKGKKIELFAYDTASLPKEGGNAASKLVSQDKVLMAMGAVASSISLAAAPVFNDAGIPMISPSSTNPDVTGIGENVFRICYLDDFQGGACAVFASKDLKAKKAAILRNQDDAYSTGLADYFSLKFKALGGEIVQDESYAGGTKDFNTQITNIKGANPDVIFVPVYYNDVALIAKQFRAQGVDAPLLGGDGWESSQLIPTAGTALEGCYFGNHYSQEDKSEKVQNFVKGYTKEYEKAPSSLAALGYDVVWVVKKAIEDADSFDRAKIREALAALKGYEGVTGKFSIDGNRNAKKAISILKVEGERFVPVRKIEPAEVK